MIEQRMGTRAWRNTTSCYLEVVSRSQAPLGNAYRCQSHVRGMGVGKALTNECIRLAQSSGNRQVILHTTKAMEVAWNMYTKLGFERSTDVDFSQEGLPVFGFRLLLHSE